MTRTPSTTAKTLAARASATLPSGVSQRPVSAPAARAWARPTREAAVDVALTPAVGPSARRGQGRQTAAMPSRAVAAPVGQRIGRDDAGAAGRQHDADAGLAAVAEARDGVGHLGGELLHGAGDGERGGAGGEALQVAVERERHAAVGADGLVDAVAEQARVEGGHGGLVGTDGAAVDEDGLGHAG